MAVAGPATPTLIRVTIKQLAIPFVLLAAYIFLRGCVGAVDAFTRALFGTAEGLVGWIPWLGRRASNGLQRVQQRLTNYLGALEDTLSRKVADSFHALATGVNQLATGLEEIAWGIGQLAWLVTSKYSVAAMSHALRGLHVGSATTKAKEKSQDATLGKVKAYTDHPATGRAGAGAKAATRPATVRITKVVNLTRAQVAAIEATVTGTLAPDIEALRARTKAITQRLSSAWRILRRHEKALGTTLLGSVAVAFIARLGGGWIFCRNWKRLGRRVCQTPASDLEILFGLLAFTAVAVDPRVVAKAGQEVAEALEPLIRATAIRD